MCVCVFERTNAETATDRGTGRGQNDETSRAATVGEVDQRAAAAAAAAAEAAAAAAAAGEEAATSTCAVKPCCATGIRHAAP